jgi:hypothetical protein
MVFMSPVCWLAREYPINSGVRLAPCLADAARNDAEQRDYVGWGACNWNVGGRNWRHLFAYGWSHSRLHRVSDHTRDRRLAVHRTRFARPVSLRSETQFFCLLWAWPWRVFASSAQRLSTPSRTRQSCSLMSRRSRSWRCFLWIEPAFVCLSVQWRPLASAASHQMGTKERPSIVLFCGS